MKKLLAFVLLFSIISGMLVSCNLEDLFKRDTTTSTIPDNTSSTTTTDKNGGGMGDSTTTAQGGGTSSTPKPDGTSSTTTSTVGGDDPVLDPDFNIDPEPAPDPIVKGKLNITLTGYSFETIFCEWAPYPGADSYNVYCDGIKVDKELIRSYGSYYRCDILGLTNKYYEIEIIPTVNGAEMLEAATAFSTKPMSHIRDGFAWVGGTASGAYNEDGTLKSNAAVIYVTNGNKDSVAFGGATGIQSILDLLKKGSVKTPVCIRFIGNITDPAYLMGGDLLVDFNTTKFTYGMTIEGVGNDATFNGFGLRVKNSSNLEIRNLGFMNCNSDEGDNVGLQQNNHHVWVHNCDFFYGDAGSDADQAKGDGALDVKTSSYITLSFNHFVDSGKSNLLGMKEESVENYITYHHNWYDHSDSRHPRVRTCTVHVYNNYYDGISKYGIGSTMGSSVFAENNYFRNTKYPMLSSLQGNDIASGGTGTFSGENGGIIKAYGNYIEGGKGIITYQQNSTSFDCYLASSRDEKVPDSVITLVGGTKYNNFDTNTSLMYEYGVEPAEDVKETVMQYAGRVQGGDFKWSFTSADDSSYAVNTALKNALKSYTGKLVSANVSGGTSSGGQGGNETPEPNPTPTPTPAGKIVHNFTADGKESNVFSITGNLSTKKGTVLYDGLTLTQCLKMESATNISFTLTEARTLTLVFAEAGKSVKIDGVKKVCTDNILTIELSAGSHTVTKADSINLFYMILE